MSDKKNIVSSVSKKVVFNPLQKGYQPNQGNFDNSNPPQGSGVPNKPGTSNSNTNSSKSAKRE